MDICAFVGIIALKTARAHYYPKSQKTGNVPVRLLI